MNNGTDLTYLAEGKGFLEVGKGYDHPVAGTDDDRDARFADSILDSCLVAVVADTDMVADSLVLAGLLGEIDGNYL